MSNQSRTNQTSAEVHYQPFEVADLMGRRETVRVGTNTMRLRLYTQHNGFAEPRNTERADQVTVSSQPTAIPDAVAGTIGLVNRETARQLTAQEQTLADARAAVDRSSLEGHTYANGA